MGFPGVAPAHQDLVCGGALCGRVWDCYTLVWCREGALCVVLCEAITPRFGVVRVIV